MTSKQDGSDVTMGLRAWFRDDNEANPEQLHKRDPGTMLSADEVFRLSGVKCVTVSVKVTVEKVRHGECGGG